MGNYAYVGADVSGNAAAPNWSMHVLIMLLRKMALILPFCSCSREGFSAIQERVKCKVEYFFFFLSNLHS